MNALLLYRRHCDLGKVAKKHQLYTLYFHITDQMRKLWNEQENWHTFNGGGSGRANVKKRRIKPVTPMPARMIQLDTARHWPEYKDVNSR